MSSTGCTQGNGTRQACPIRYPMGCGCLMTLRDQVEGRKQKKTGSGNLNCYLNRCYGIGFPINGRAGCRAGAKMAAEFGITSWHFVTFGLNALQRQSDCHMRNAIHETHTMNILSPLHRPLHHLHWSRLLHCRLHCLLH